MLPFRLDELSGTAMAGLKSQQDRVDKEPTHALRYQKATQLFAGKSPKKAFNEVRSALAAASPAGEACFYCERDRYRDIEHVAPKRHYPERSFDWFNYVYACVICNQDAKRDTYAVFLNETDIIEFDRSLPIDDPVPSGDPVLIDPRTEDPLAFLRLDFDTGSLVPVGNARDKVRGKYTRDLFNLDSSDLLRIRRNYVEFYLTRCVAYVDAIDAHDEVTAKRILDDILGMEHPTVIVELRRQSVSHPRLAAIFARLPSEVGQWQS